MTTQEFIRLLEQEQINIVKLKTCYDDDSTHKTFRGWFVWLMSEQYDVSRYVASKVADHFGIK
jgi:hypothetical protein